MFEVTFANETTACLVVSAIVFRAAMLEEKATSANAVHRRELWFSAAAMELRFGNIEAAEEYTRKGNLANSQRI